MRLTRFSDIGMRVLIYLTRAGGKPAPATVAEIAKQFDIPANHLVKVVGQLARAGWVETTRGRNGGIALKVEPAALKVGTVLRELEGDTELVDCNGLNCHLKQNCILRGALATGLRAFYDAMDRYTLADITEGAVGEQIVLMHRSFLRRTELQDPA